jgi:hypothetical protein
MAMEFIAKMPHSAIVNSKHPVGRDSVKKMKATDFIVDKVMDGIANAIALQAVEKTSLRLSKKTCQRQKTSCRPW